MITTCKQALSRILDTAGVLDWQLQRRGDEGILFIPMYHRVIRKPEEDPLKMGMCVMEATFEQQLQYFKQDYDILTLQEIIKLLEDGHRLPRRTLSITFDDGYLDNLEVAAPILKSHGLRATLFVTTGYLGSEDGFWWDHVINSIGNAIEHELDLKALGMSSEKLIITESNRKPLTHRILNNLWQLPIDTVETIVKQLRNLFSSKSTYGPKVIEKNQISLLQDIAFDIGSHTVRHPNLKYMKEEEVASELHESNALLESILHKDLLGFAAPGGFTPTFLPAMLKEKGFKYAVSTERGLNRHIHLYSLQRIGMPESTVSDLKRSICTL